MKNIIIILMLLICSLCMLCNHTLAEIPKLQEAEELLADRNYPEAFAALQQLSEKGKEQPDYLLLLMGNALFYQKQYHKAIELYERLIVEYPESVWKQKALFKQADCYMQLKQFDQAEKIYEQEVIRLVSPERKERIAEVYLKFADEYFTGKWVERTGQQGVEKPVLSGVEGQPDYARAKTFYELALQMELGKAKQEEIRYQVARCAFELGDYAGAISTLTALQKDYPEGKYLTKVIYYLGQSYLKQGQFIQARKVLRDFIEAYPDDPNAPEAAFLLSRTYNIPNPNSAEELELGVKSLQDFIEIYPDHERVFQAAYEIGLSYYHFSRYDDAIAAFRAYIKKYEETHPFPSREGTSVSQTAQFPSREGPGVGSQTRTFTVYDGLALSRYYLGKVYQRQRKFEEAIAVWKEYLQKHPSDQQWSEVQQQIIETEYLIADKLFREKQYEAARTTWEQFLADHPLDGRNPAIMFRIGLTYFNLAEELESLGSAGVSAGC
jgi:TolA-binding protein